MATALGVANITLKSKDGNDRPQGKTTHHESTIGGDGDDRSGIGGDVQLRR
jgi:hypothetical protein